MKENNIQVGDSVLLKRNSTKHDSVYNPEPYIVTKKYGTQIVGVRGDSKVQDSQRWKKVAIKEKRSYREKEKWSLYTKEPYIGAGTQRQEDRQEVRPVGNA